MNDNSDRQIAEEYIQAFDRPMPTTLAILQPTHEIYESDGGAFFAVKKDAPDLAHALASSAAQGDADAIDAIYADTDEEVEREYRMKYGKKASGNASSIDRASKLK
jgi:hypothetical protein